MTILVTGGAGYIGSHFVKRLQEIGEDLVVLDDLSTGRKESLLGAPLVVGDVADAELVSRICQEHRIESCVHFAGLKNVGDSMAYPESYWRANVAGSAALLGALSRAGVDRFVFSSSCSIFGTPDAMPVAEDSPLRPESVYAESKAMVESILRWQVKTRGMNSISLRYFNAAGAATGAVLGEDWTTSQNLIPVVMQAALGLREEVQLFGGDYDTPDGTCIRDYVHVDDLADAHLAALEVLRQDGANSESPRARAVNLGTGTGTSVLEVIRTAAAVCGKEVPYRIVNRRPGDPSAIWADPNGAEELLNWRARHDIPEILESAWRWHRSQL